MNRIPKIAKVRRDCWEVCVFKAQLRERETHTHTQRQETEC